MSESDFMEKQLNYEVATHEIRRQMFSIDVDTRGLTNYLAQRSRISRVDAIELGSMQCR